MNRRNLLQGIAAALVAPYTPRLTDAEDASNLLCVAVGKDGSTFIFNKELLADVAKAYVRDLLGQQSWARKFLPPRGIEETSG